MNDETRSGEHLNDTTITQEQEGQDWRLCEEGSPECGEFEQWEAV